MNQKKQNKQNKAVRAWHESDPNIPSDVRGSYTGTPSKNGVLLDNDRPDQDGDDI